MKFLKNPFSSNRSVITDLFLIFMLFISQEMFYFLLSIFYRKYLEKLCLERDTISDILFRNSKNLKKEKDILAF